MKDSDGFCSFEGVLDTNQRCFCESANFNNLFNNQSNVNLNPNTVIHNLVNLLFNWFDIKLLNNLLFFMTNYSWISFDFPRGNDKRGWSGLDEELKQGLKKSLKDGSVKSFSDFIYNKCIERFGVVPVKRPQEKKDSRRQRELGRLKGEKKALRRRWKVAKEDEREGLSVLWEDVKRRARDLRRAERGRQRKYERRRAMRSFF